MKWIRQKKMADELGVGFKIVEIYTPISVAGEWKPCKPIEKSSKVHTDIVEKCYSLWQVATINFNGDVFPCCSEFSPKDVLGNVLDEPFKKIWNNRRYKDLRKKNIARLNCNACHVDKNTNWYKLWMAK